MTTTAVIFVPAAHLAAFASTCFDYCTTRHYEVIGLVTTTWEAAAAMLLNRSAGVIVVATANYLPADHEPRVEVVAEQQHVAPVRQHQRTRVIRRGAAT